MNDYTEVRLGLDPCTEIHTDILAAMLAEKGYESFVPDATGLTAYIRKEEFNPDLLDEVIREFPMETVITSTHSVVEGQDWNAEWEKNYFKPIVIDDQCVIHSSFHKDIPECRYDIVIDPKMAFGTGHHATTTLILRRLLSMDLEGKKMVDMGTGTGILAIIADMRGAAHIDAVEIDEFAFENAKENLRLNHTSRVEPHLGDARVLATIRDVDIFVANINRNIITADLPAYADTLSTGASVILSGFYEEDIPVIMKVAEAMGLAYADHTVLDRWASLHLKKGI
ncbi:50S ribosomal protein L11 methyltransferase [uncultured Duncaniella sp.]|uniref:50S ribosomal protein L11 methyltransferase n=1 Tax=uncultured Duncaniella sp. TaxID=2768039 RepID=UPI002674D5E2|nr:50S ribosomal protein L11 methyltransferase [uncultured Duncaniella sp.]MCI9172861.1 50S ribosomal protein L11 methyltransferase [Muribaculaceae bacterium]